MARHQTFTKLVQTENDFVGMVAYTIYKREKLDWIRTYKGTYGDEPSDDTIRQQFNLDTDTTSKIDMYRQLAVIVVNEFLNQTLADRLAEYEAEVKDNAIVQAVNTKDSQLKQLFELKHSEIIQLVKQEHIDLKKLIDDNHNELLPKVETNFVKDIVRDTVINIVATILTGVVIYLILLASKFNFNQLLEILLQPAKP